MYMADRKRESSTLSASLAANNGAVLNDLVQEIDDLGNSGWHFIVGWILGVISAVAISYLVVHYQLLNKDETLYFYAFFGICVISAGIDIHRHLQRTNRRIDKVVELVLLSANPSKE